LDFLIKDTKLTFQTYINIIKYHKMWCISCSKDYTYKLVYLSFLITLDLELLKKLFSPCYVGPNFFASGWIFWLI
jgi:hypothetical protein